jgi:CitMHS family citrate-Mg2+:H+ or citrate-Ca2+:H+ symporter
VIGMFVFAILFFGIITDAGLLDPIVTRVLRMVGARPSRITVGTAALALLVHLDGSGAVCFLVTIPAMMPLYDRLGMDRRVLACTAALAAGVNFLPWTGPTLRASAALHIPVSAIFRPMVGVQAIGLVFILATAWWLGRREELRLGPIVADVRDLIDRALPQEQEALRRPRLFWVNLLLTLVVIVTLTSGALEPAITFMAGTAIALMINYPASELQRGRIDAHARASLSMAAILFAAGTFTGIMNGSGMIKAMAEALTRAVPDTLGSHIPAMLAVVAMPLSLVFDPDSFYFGVLPVMAQSAEHFGIQPVQLAQAALVGQMTTGFPISPLTPATFLVAGLSRIDLGAHQRFTFPWLYAASLMMAIGCVLFGLFSL